MKKKIKKEKEKRKNNMSLVKNTDRSIKNGKTLHANTKSLLLGNFKLEEKKKHHYLLMGINEMFVFFSK